MRYIGNKQRLLEDIKTFFQENGILKENYTMFDAFSGTGSVGNYFKDIFKIIANDNLHFSYIYTSAKLNPISKDFPKLGIDPFDFFNKENAEKIGFITKNYSPEFSERKYFSSENAKRIDYIRTHIDEWHKNDKINDSEKNYLVACLLESLSKVSNVAGVYGAYLKTWDSRALKRMKFIDVENINHNNRFQNEVHNTQVETLIHDLKGDILYLDPPYSKNQYATQYHLLETISRYDDPELFGKTGYRERVSKNSDFSKEGNAQIQFTKLIKYANFRYIVLSYNSDGIMSPQFIEKVLKRYGKESTYKFKKIPYGRYTTNRTNQKRAHFEYLFFVEKKDKLEVEFKSPLNYQGGKYDLIPFIRENLPKDIYRFIDLFGGGFNVGINIDAQQIIYNDTNHKVKEILETFRNKEIVWIYQYLQKNISKYKLEKTNKKTFEKLRTEYNSIEEKLRPPEMLYLLILYGFNQQIRFNKKLEYNNTIGPSGFNERIFEIMISFAEELKNKNVVFFSEDFENMMEHINKKTFVYIDPPYLITTGSYNDGKRGFEGWGENEEKRLLKFLELLNKKGIKFMMSNIMTNKKKEENTILKEWVLKNKFSIVEYKQKYRKNRKEIIIKNY